jgi:hypothetical protein
VLVTVVAVVGAVEFEVVSVGDPEQAAAVNASETTTNESRDVRVDGVIFRHDTRCIVLRRRVARCCLRLLSIVVG